MANRIVGTIIRNRRKSSIATIGGEEQGKVKCYVGRGMMKTNRKKDIMRTRRVIQKIFRIKYQLSINTHKIFEIKYHL